MLSAELLSEYQTLTQGAGYVDVSNRTKLEFRGDDRVTFLHNFCTNDIKRLPPGQHCEAFVCDVKGHTLGHISVYCEEAALWIDTVPNQAAKLLAHWDRYLIREKVEMFDHTGENGALLLLGSQIPEKLASLRDSLAGVIRPWLLASVQLLTFPIAEQARAEANLQSANIRACSAAAWEMVRMEAGLPQYGIDINQENLPQEVGRDRLAISFTKGCYLGQETVARIDALGHVNKTLRGLELMENTLPTPGTELSAEGKVVAWLTSVGWSPQRKKTIALGYVRRGFDKIGTMIGTAQVVEL